jgi:phospholipid/cholesterol/gamma-HCH transport system substrate-binding protein
MKLTNEAKIGVLVAAVFVILGVLTWKTGNFSFVPDGYEIKIQFNDVQGLSKNAPVTLNGLEEGRVKDVVIVYGEIPQIQLTLWLKSEAKIPKGAKAYVRTMGFMGEKFVAIEMTDSKDGFLAPGSMIVGEVPASMERVLVQAETMAKNLTVITEEIKGHLQNNHQEIDEMIKGLHVTSKNLSTITTNVNERLAVNSKYIDEMVNHLNSTSGNLEEMSYDLKLNPWKLLYRDKAKKAAKIPAKVDAP